MSPPASAIQAPPAIMAATAITSCTSSGGALLTAMPAAAAATPPTTSAPSLPMIISPMRAGSAVQSAVRISGAARVSVFCHENQEPKAPWYMSS